MAMAGERNDLGAYGRCRNHEAIPYQNQLVALKKLGIRQARSVLTSMGNPVDVDPVGALIFLVQEAAGNVAFLGARIQDLGYDLVGPVFSLTRDGEPVQTSEDILAIVKLYNDERDRLARVSKIALDAGIEERTVRVLEEQATVLVTVIRSVVGNLGLPPEVRQRAMALVSAELRRIDEAPIEGRGVEVFTDVTPTETKPSNGSDPASPVQSTRDPDGRA
jgi:hypothetical protein